MENIYNLYEKCYWLHYKLEKTYKIYFHYIINTVIWKCYFGKNRQFYKIHKYERRS